MASSPAVAAAIIRPLLHPAVAAAIDWDSLELLPNEFTGDAGETTRADLIFRARFKGREGYIIVLLEHQSRPDPMMPWRALVYMVGIWRGWLEHHPGARHLPPVVPVVLYNGRLPILWRFGFPLMLSRCAEARRLNDPTVVQSAQKKTQGGLALGARNPSGYLF